MQIARLAQKVSRVSVAIDVQVVMEQFELEVVHVQVSGPILQNGYRGLLIITVVVWVMLSSYSYPVTDSRPKSIPKEDFEILASSRKSQQEQHEGNEPSYRAIRCRNTSLSLRKSTTSWRKA